MIAARHRLFRSTYSVLQAKRNSSSNVSVEVEDKSGIAVVSMNKKPVNSLNLEFLAEIGQTFQQLTKEKACKGVVLTSGTQVFSAGLDIMEMYQPKEDRLAEFWRTLQNTWMTVYGSKLPVIACINGHSPAGGCLFAMSCDYRIIVPKVSIGLNETKLGIVAPFWFRDGMNATIGHRQTELAMQLGTLFSSEEALDIGLVDRISPVDSILEDCKEELSKWIQIPALARYMSKMSLRKGIIDNLKSKQEDDINQFVGFCNTDIVQKSLEAYLKAMKKK